MNWIKRLFNKKETIIEDQPTPEETNQEEVVSEWVEFRLQKPPHEVVLAACDTYDCGWVMDTAWWYEEKKCWMVTGHLNTTKAHLPYTHWRKLPPFPNGEL